MALEQSTQSQSKTASSLDYDVVIVGGNISGLTLAATLQQSNLRIAIAEATPLESAASRDRAYAISVLSGRIFEGLDIWDEMLPNIGKFRHIRLSDGDFPQAVAFETKDIQSDYVGYAAEHYVLPNLALIGDAAHRCHPVGGQGLNLGIRDAAALGEVLKQARDRGEAVGHLNVLKQYQRWRKTENLAILGVTDLLDRSFFNQFLPMVLSRRTGIWMMQNVPPLKRFALEIMTGLKGKKPALAMAKK